MPSIPWIIPISAIYVLFAAILVKMAWPYRTQFLHQQQPPSPEPHEPLPPVIPAWQADLSEPRTPTQTNDWIDYCPQCWLEWLRDHPSGSYFEPEGYPQFCIDHAYMTLARAMGEQALQKEKY